MTKIPGVTRGGDLSGTSLQGEINASFKQIRDLLGESEESDGYKVSTMWTCVFEGKTFTVYDYKETSLYSDDLPSVEEFQARESYAWHIGGSGNAEAFIAAIKAAL